VIIEVGDRVVPGPRTSYSDVTEGTPLALFGSSGHLEIAVRNGSAREQLGLSRGNTITLRRRTDKA